MTSPAYLVASYLDSVDQGTLGTDLFVSTEPAGPDSTVTLYDTGGQEPEPDQDLWRPTIQVRVRDKDYLAAYGKQQSIRDTLIGPPGFTQGGYRVLGVFPSSDVIAIGRDDNDRFRLTLNYRLLIKEA